MAKKKFDQLIDELDALRDTPDAPETVAALKAALAHKNNFVVKKAARIVGEQGQQALVPNLLSALDRFFEDPVKTDPQCWAKTAIFKALNELGHDDADVFLRGLRYVQMEPVWGGREDMAGGVRAQCASALVSCRSIADVALLGRLVELLADPDKSVRVEAVRAVGRVGRSESSLLLRLRALVGDPEPEVIGACFAAILQMDGEPGIGFVSQFFDRGGEAAEEAAIALGESRDERAFETLRERWERGSDPSLRKVLLSAMALTRLPEAVRLLAGIVRSEPIDVALEAVRAVASARLSAEMKGEFEAAVRKRGDGRIVSAWGDQ